MRDHDAKARALGQDLNARATLNILRDDVLELAGLHRTGQRPPEPLAVNPTCPCCRPLAAEIVKARKREQRLLALWLSV